MKNHIVNESGIDWWLSVLFYPYHFVLTILSIPFCSLPFCTYTILSIQFCPYHFVRYHFLLTFITECELREEPSAFDWPLARKCEENFGWRAINLVVSLRSDCIGESLFRYPEILVLGFKSNVLLLRNIAWIRFTPLFLYFLNDLSALSTAI